jgi:NitT/TauT family transport system substrate-binding protein
MAGSRTTRLLAGGLGVLMAVAALAGCGGGGSGSSGSGALPTIRLAVSITTPDVAQSYYTSLPQQLGYWKQAGVNVQLEFFDGDAAGLQAVAAGKADASISGTNTIVTALDNGQSLIGYMVDARKNLYYPAAPAGSGITTMSDFNGKTVGLQSLTSSSYGILKGILKLSGVDPNAVHYVSVGTGAEVAAAIKQRRIDTYQASTNLYSALQPYGVDLRPVPSQVSDQMGFSTALETPTANLTSHLKEYVALAKGIAEARAFAAANPRAAVLLHWKAYPTVKPTSIPENEAITDAVAQLQSRLSVAAVDSDGTYGHGNQQQIASTLKVYQAGGIMTKPLTAGQVFTDKYVDQINDFDLKAIQHQAADYKVS